MSHHAQSRLREAPSLSDEERADLVAELVVSLEGPFEDDEAATEQAWEHEVEDTASRGGLYLACAEKLSATLLTRLARSAPVALEVHE